MLKRITYQAMNQHRATNVFDLALMALLFGENPQAVAYSAQPLCSGG